MTKEELHQLVAEGTGNESNIRQICAIKDDKTVYSDCWRGFAADSPVHVASVTKGVMAVLTGIAIDRGYINSTQQKVLDFFPDYAVRIKGLYNFSSVFRNSIQIAVGCLNGIYTVIAFYYIIVSYRAVNQICNPCQYLSLGGKNAVFILIRYPSIKIILITILFVFNKPVDR